MPTRYLTLSAVMLFLFRDSPNGKEVLLQKRQNTGYADGMWDCAVAGHVDANESMKMAIRREAGEELGLDIPLESISFVTMTHKRSLNTGETYYNGFFTAENYQGTPQIKEPHKCADLRWFSLEALPDNVIPNRRNALHNCLQHVPYSEEGWGQ